MTDGWKDKAYSRIEQVIESLETIEALGICPVCTFVKENLGIIPDNPDAGCFGDELDDECPARMSCSVYVDIVEYGGHHKAEELTALIDMIGKDSYDSYEFYQDKDEWDDDEDD